MIPNFPISPGDTFQVNIWLFSDTTANIAIFGGDASALISVDGSQSGFRLKGGSAEWIVERPTVGGAFTTLANYGHTFFANALAWVDYGITLFPGSGIPVSMRDDG